MQVWCLVDILKHPSASSSTAYSGCQCDAHLEYLHGAQSGEPPQLIRIHLSCGLQNMWYCALANWSMEQHLFYLLCLISVPLNRRTETLVRKLFNAVLVFEGVLGHIRLQGLNQGKWKSLLSSLAYRVIYWLLGKWALDTRVHGYLAEQGGSTIEETVWNKGHFLDLKKAAC